MLQLDRTTDDLGCTRPSKQERFSSLIHSQRRQRKMTEREREGEGQGEGNFSKFLLIPLRSVFCRNWLRGHTEFARVGG